MTADGFIGWLHDLRYSRMVCMLLPTEAVMGYPLPVVRGNGRALLIPFFGHTAEGAYRPCGVVAVLYGADSIIAYSAAQWLGSAAEAAVRLYSGEAQRMDAYYSRLAAWEAPGEAQCADLQRALLDMLEPDMAQFYQSIIPE